MNPEETKNPENEAVTPQDTTDQSVGPVQQPAVIEQSPPVQTQPLQNVASQSSAPDVESSSEVNPPVQESVSVSSEPAPAPPAAADPESTTQQSAASPANKFSKKRLLLLLLPALAIITLIGILLGTQVFSSRMKLKKFSNDVYSISYPDGFEEETSGSTTYFKEPGELTDETLSAVIVIEEDLPLGLENDQKNLIKSKLAENVEGFLNTAASQSGQEIRNKVAEKAKIGDQEAESVSAELYKGEEKVASFYTRSGLIGDKRVLLAVLVHTSDKELDSKANDILNSFELK